MNNINNFNNNNNKNIFFSLLKWSEIKTFFSSISKESFNILEKLNISGLDLCLNNNDKFLNKIGIKNFHDISLIKETIFSKLAIFYYQLQKIFIQIK